MSYKPLFVKGDWKADCDACGKTFHASELRKRWDGFMVCSKDFEVRQPQDFVRGVADTQAPPWVRDEPADTISTGTTLPGVGGIGGSGGGFSSVPTSVPVAIIVLGNPSLT